MGNDQPLRVRSQTLLIAATFTVVFGALVTGAAVWYVSRLSDQAQGPTPMALARQVGAAHLGCLPPHVDRDAAARPLDRTQGEVECGAGATYITIARFDSQRIARVSMHAYACAASQSVNPSYGFHDQWAFYAISPSTERSVASLLHARVVRDC